MTVVDQNEADRDCDKLRKLKTAFPDAKAFVSIEPMLGPINLSAYANWLDWVIVGGESGTKARPMHPAWVRSIRDQCEAANIPFFFKQWGEWLGGEMNDFGEFQRFDAASDSAFILKNYDHDRVHFFEPDMFPGGPVGVRVGKKAAGDKLDGLQHHNWPVVR